MSGTYTFEGMRVPDHTMAALVDYVQNGWQPGSFLEAVLCNNLKDACACADPENLRNIPAIVSWLYCMAPSNCWGSLERYEKWLAQFAERKQP